MDSPCRSGQDCNHEPDDGDRRARNAQVFPITDTDAGVDDLPPRAIDRAGQRIRGKIKDARLGVVDQDGGTQALKIREAFDSVRANMQTFVPVYYDDETKAR